MIDEQVADERPFSARYRNDADLDAPAVNVAEAVRYELRCRQSPASAIQQRIWPMTTIEKHPQSEGNLAYMPATSGQHVEHFTQLDGKRLSSGQP